MSGALNPSNGVNRFHASTTTASSTFGTPECGPTAAAAAAAAAASFLELTNTAAAAAAVAAAASASAGDFGYDFGLGGFRAPPPPAHTSAAAAANFGVSYFTSDAAAAAAAAAENYASLAWEAQSAALAAAAASPYHQGQPAPHFTSCDFGPFSIPGPGCPGGRIPGMAVQRFGSQVRGSACGTNGGSAGHNGGGQSHGTTTKSKPRRRVATIAQRRAANIRERRRMFNLNSAFDKLRKKVPTFAYEKRLSRIETLRLAIMYIAFMTEVIRGKDQDRHPNHDSHIGLPPAPYTAGHALTDGHLWTPSHGTSPLTDGAVPRSERLSHLCSRQV